MFQSLQGEGPSIGSPCLFLRLALCNLRCRWCDTAYSWDATRYQLQDEVTLHAPEDVGQRIEATGCRRVVITGGEPLLQQDALARLLVHLPPALQIEVETNGTIEPCRDLLARVEQWNASPKLANSGEPAERRLKLGPLHILQRTGRAWLKLVIDTPEDLAEVDRLVQLLGWPRDRVVLMPQAATREELWRKAEFVVTAALARQFRYSSRLQVELWGNQRGR